jgi:hypothetical protein
VNTFRSDGELVDTIHSFQPEATKDHHLDYFHGRNQSIPHIHRHFEPPVVDVAGYRRTLSSTNLLELWERANADDQEPEADGLGDGLGFSCNSSIVSSVEDEHRALLGNPSRRLNLLDLLNLFFCNLAPLNSHLESRLDEEKEFFRLLLSELDKINQFYTGKRHICSLQLKKGAQENY